MGEIGQTQVSSLLSSDSHKKAQLEKKSFIDKIKEWSRGRFWFFRTLLVLYMGYVLYRYLAYPMEATLFSGINLGIHEAGHLIAGLITHNVTIVVAAGSFFELTAPLIVMIGLLQSRDYFGSAFIVGWIGTGAIELSVYIADARAEVLPLVSMGSGEPIHDWHYLLEKMNMLPQDHLIGFMVKLLGIGMICFFLIAGTWMIWYMWKTRKEIPGLTRL